MRASGSSPDLAAAGRRSLMESGRGRAQQLGQDDAGGPGGGGDTACQRCWAIRGLPRIATHVHHSIGPGWRTSEERAGPGQAFNDHADDGQVHACVHPQHGDGARICAGHRAGIICPCHRQGRLIYRLCSQCHSSGRRRTKPSGLTSRSGN